MGNMLVLSFQYFIPDSAANSHADTMDTGCQVCSKHYEAFLGKNCSGFSLLISKILFNNHLNRGVIYFTFLEESVNIAMLCDHVLVIRFIMSIILS